MAHRKKFSDQRLDDTCAYCGQSSESKDHVPSKALLDEPFPENLPVVPCCLKCNQDFSSHEEYIACAIECAICGTAQIAGLNREKIKNTFLKNQKLQQSFESSFILENQERFFKIDTDRLNKVITKLAKGHAKFENSESKIEEPTTVNFQALSSMSQKEIENFIAPVSLSLFPEVGSRALQSIHIDDNNNVASNWIIVQDNKYQYSVIVGAGSFVVKIVLWNFLAIEVIWLDN